MVKVKLGDYVEVDSGFAFKSNFFNEKEGIPIIRIRDVNSGKTNTFYTGDYDGKYVVNNGDLLITMDGEFKIKEWLGGKSLLNQRVSRIRSKTKTLNERYLLYLLPKVLKNIEDKTPFVTVKHLSVKEIVESVVFIPNLTIQEKIIETLDIAKSLIEKRKLQLTALSKLPQSVFLEMFGDPAINANNYKVESLGHNLKFLTSGSRGWAKYYSKSGEIFITIKNVKNGELILDNVTYVNAPETKEAERTKVQNGDLLISITADLGRTAVVSEDIAENGAYINQHLSLIRLKENCNPYYISFYLESAAGRRQFQALNQEGVKAGLNFDAIKSIEIPIPPLELQRKFEETFLKVNEQKKEIESSLMVLEDFFNSLMQRVLNGELFNE